jgi:23S rRNA (cytosine1962-C5)-methyltransferase
MFPEIKLKPQEDRRLRRGHLWVFSNEVAEAPADVAPGSVVRFLTARRELLGTGFYNPRSLIAGRLLDRHAVEPDDMFFETRLRRSMEQRAPFYADTAYRLAFGESDDLPGLVVDRYDGAVVVESYCAGMDLLWPALRAALERIHPWEVIVRRNDAPARRMEGVELFSRVEKGTLAAPRAFSSEGIRLVADLAGGQKTGFFFDQRDNRRTVAALAKDKRVLDLFCHTGGFGLWCARAGAKSVLGVDESETALGLAGEAARANGWNDTMTFEKADVFAWLEACRETYDIVVADPPSFAPGKKQLPAAVKAYVRLNAMALRRVVGGGFLATASCSHHVDRETFRQILSRAVHESGRRGRLVVWGGAAPDHPVRLAMPETEYLHFALLQVS